jgi:arginyl-tRNA synthetase
MGKAFGEEYATRDPMLAPATNAKFGDYQSNAALPLAKPLGLKPRDAANKLLECLDLSITSTTASDNDSLGIGPSVVEQNTMQEQGVKDANDEVDIIAVFETPTIAGPGFINFALTDSFVTSRLSAMNVDPVRLGVPVAKHSERVVVDFSSPNIAKEMHVGHLRSTILGDTLSRVLEFRGHDVVSEKEKAKGLHLVWLLHTPIFFSRINNSWHLFWLLRLPDPVFPRCFLISLSSPCHLFFNQQQRVDTRL